MMYLLLDCNEENKGLKKMIDATGIDLTDPERKIDNHAINVLYEYVKTQSRTDICQKSDKSIDTKRVQKPRK